MCNLCEKIWDTIEGYKEGKFSWDETNIIYRSNGYTYLYLPCADSYYTWSMKIRYYPMCGRNLEK